jgi:hypothetical protein
MNQQNSLAVFMKNMESLGRGVIEFSNGVGNVVTQIELFINNNSEAIDKFIKNVTFYALYIGKNSDKILTFIDGLEKLNDLIDEDLLELPPVDAIEIIEFLYEQKKFMVTSSGRIIIGSEFLPPKIPEQPDEPSKIIKSLKAVLQWFVIPHIGTEVVSPVLKQITEKISDYYS